MPYGIPYGSFSPGVRQDPVSSFVTGLGAGSTLQDAALRRRVAQEALQRKEAERDAMKRYSLSGDLRDVYPVMEPEKAAMLSLKLPEAQLSIMQKAMDWFRDVGVGATLETYPALREDFLSKFTQINPSVVPPVERFKSEEELQRYLMLPKKLAAEMDALKSPYASRPTVIPQGAGYILPGEQRLREGPDKTFRLHTPRLFESPDGTQRMEYQPGSGQVPPAGWKEIGTPGRSATGATRFPSFQEFWDEVKSGNNPDLPAGTSYNDAVKHFNRQIAGGKAEGAGEAPEKKLKASILENLKAKTDVLREQNKPKPGFFSNMFGKGQVGTPTPTAPKTHKVRDTETGELVPVTEEQYNQILKHRKK